MTEIEVAREAFLNMISDARTWRENVDGDTDASGRGIVYVDYDLNVGNSQLEGLASALGINREYTESLKDAIDRYCAMPAIEPGKSGGPTIAEPNKPMCKPDGSCCDFACGN